MSDMHKLEIAMLPVSVGVTVEESLGGEFWRLIQGRVIDELTKAHLAGQVHPAFQGLRASPVFMAKITDGAAAPPPPVTPPGQDLDRAMDAAYDAFMIHAEGDSLCCILRQPIDRSSLCCEGIALLDLARDNGCVIAGCCGVLMNSALVCAHDGMDD